MIIRYGRRQARELGPSDWPHIPVTQHCSIALVWQAAQGHSARFLGAGLLAGLQHCALKGAACAAAALC